MSAAPSLRRLPAKKRASRGTSSCSVSASPLLFVGHVLIATGLRAALGRAWILPPIGAVSILVAITLNTDPIHDIGLFVFENAWVALGIALMQMGRRGEPRDGVPAPV